ncbi:MAG: class I adenylate-forming enzyme family protein [Ignavibacteriales bacterium]
MVSNAAIASRIKEVFKNGWNEEFIIDALRNESYKYKEFFGLAINCREILQSLGINKNDIVSFLLPNSMDLCLFYFAALSMQAVVAPIDPQKGEDEIKEILSITKSKIIISERDINEYGAIKISDLKDRIYLENQSDNLDVFDNIDYKKLYLISFTSGSTGVPKGVKNSFGNLFLTSTAFAKKFNFNKEHIFYHNLPMSYMAGILNTIFLPFISGSRIIIGERFSVASIMRFWAYPEKYRANVFWFTPTIISMLMKLDRGTKGIEYAKGKEIIGCAGTAPLNYKMKESFEDRYKGIKIYESYGLSELLFIASNSPFEKPLENSVGSLLEGAEVSFDEDGEILVNVPWMFLGYVNVETEPYFKSGKYKTGDIGIFEENGLLRITGRKKDLIIRGGTNISPRKTEVFVSQYQCFDEFVILGMPDEILGEKTVCYYTDINNCFDDTKKNEINKNIIKKLGNDYRIDEFVKLEDIPKNPNGKIDKIIIKENYLRGEK